VSDQEDRDHLGEVAGDGLAVNENGVLFEEKLTLRIGMNFSE
jgi:hypothetical protein